MSLSIAYILFLFCALPFIIAYSLNALHEFTLDVVRTYKSANRALHLAGVCILFNDDTCLVSLANRHTTEKILSERELDIVDQFSDWQVPGNYYNEPNGYSIENQIDDATPGDILFGLQYGEAHAILDKIDVSGYPLLCDDDYGFIQNEQIIIAIEGGSYSFTSESDELKDYIECELQNDDNLIYGYCLELVGIGEDFHGGYWFDIDLDILLQNPISNCFVMSQLKDDIKQSQSKIEMLQSQGNRESYNVAPPYYYERGCTDYYTYLIELGNLIRKEYDTLENLYTVQGQLNTK